LARYAWWRTLRRETFRDTQSMHIGDTSMQRMTVVAEPQAGRKAAQLYGKLVNVYRACEEEVVRAC